MPTRLAAALVVTGLAMSLAGPVIAQDTPRASREVAVRITTALGDIDIVVDVGRAPVTAENFLKYVDASLYDGGIFYRVTRDDNYTPTPPNRPMMHVIQGGLSAANKPKAFAPIPLERTSVTGLKHVPGVVSMARGTADSATSEFFILLDEAQPSLDFGGKRFDDEQGAAAFGHVTAGMDVVRQIQQQRPMQANNVQYLVTPLAITSIHRR
jgi:peptidyl-prolyl cis-trans isomerase A (cyclophilin A)